MMSDISDKLEEKELHSAGVNVPIDEMAPNDSLISTGGIQDSLVQLRELCAKLKGAGLDVYNVCFSNGQIDDTPHEFPEGERALYWVGNRKFSDCSLKYSEEVDPIPAHRIYLTRRSEFFRAMFGVNRAGKWYEGAAEFPIVDLSLPDSQSFLVMLKYLYTGEIYVLKDDCANARGFCGVLANSEYLLVDGLSEELYKLGDFDAVIKKCLERMLRPTVLFFERDVIRSKIWDSSLQLAKTMESPLPAIFSSSSEVRESDRITPQTVSPSFMDGWAKQSKDGKVTRTTMLKWASKVTDGGPTEELRNTLSKCEAMKELSGEEITMFVKKNGDSVLRLLDAHTVYEALATRPVPDVVRRCTVCSLDIPMKYQHQIKCLRTHTGGAINSSISNCCVARASTCYSRAHKFQ
eukprot:856628_1